MAKNVSGPVPLAQSSTVFVTEPPIVSARGEVIEISVVTGCQRHVVAMTRSSLHAMTDQALAILTGNPATVVRLKATG